MKILIKSAYIVDPRGIYHQTIKDIQIQDNCIQKIADHIDAPQDYEIIAIPNIKISPGWFDESVCFGEPGFEDRENINNGLQVAALSGFTEVALQPNTYPVIDHQSLVSFVKDSAKNHLVGLYPIGAFTKGSEGLDMAELFDMKKAGAIAFGDYKKDIAQANLLKIGLQYVQDFDALLIVFAQEASIKGHGVVHEGIVSTSLGLKGIPELSESISIARNLKLLEYTGGKMHIPTISTPASLQLIKEAKAKGLKVTCSVAIHQLLIEDKWLESFDTRYKVSPPLRSKSISKALIEGF
jgi:dihydroorotase